MYQTRLKVEEILEVDCPKCNARANTFCDRSKERLRGKARWLRSQGVPPSHTERMWLRQGHDPSEFADLWEGMKPGKYQARGSRQGGDSRMFKQGAPGTSYGSGYGL